ncbi:integral membrane [Fusarium sporotrichioides]|uniref:Integral membrane n=1 Tax=Fusarium sporotrichioides TaxID=5514 RepID=A0A395SRA2_FUSSP|nr:integral membrane [Fusarium sporotrichioides]
MSGPPTPPSDGSPYIPITDRSAALARIHIGVTSPLIAIALAMFVARIWLRARPTWRISWEDYSMTIGVAAACVDFGFLIPQMFTQPTLITEEQRIWTRKYSFLAIPVWGVAMMFIKVSIAMMMLRIQPNILWWRIFCISIISVLLAYGVANTVFILLQCRPLEASWDASVLQMVDGASCLPRTGILIMSNLGAGINIATDILLSLAPTLFLWKLKRPIKEKILVGALMGLGIFASITSIVKATLVKEFGGPTEDPWALLNAIATWTALEQILIMIASSAPFLKPLVQSALHRMGWTLSGTSAARSGYGNHFRDMNGQGVRQSRIITNKSTNSRRDIYGEDEDPFAVGEGVDAIPLELKVLDRGKGAEESGISTIRATQDSLTARSWESRDERGSMDREYTPSHAV